MIVDRCIVGDCREVMRELRPGSIDAIVTDPPYGLGFMGKHWDHGVPGAEYWALALQVAKPGAHLVAFGGTRAFHRLACAIEDAGWELRDTIGYAHESGGAGDCPWLLAWTYGSGFPKSKNLGGDWKGWGTALKPAWEPIVLARKPLIGTVEANVLQFGTGAINVDGCRIPTDDDLNGGAYSVEREPSRSEWVKHGGTIHNSTGKDYVQPPRRWPANLIHDGSDEVVALFPSEAGAQAPVTRRNGDKFKTAYGAFSGNRDEAGSTFQGDSGSAARFFYCPKASRQDRNDGCEEFDKRPLHWSSGDQSPGTFQAAGTDRSANNAHPTVKPTALMRYLCRLVTPPGGLILDPFAGSGSTGKAAILEGYRVLCIEQEAEYAEIANARMEWARKGLADQVRKDGAMTAQADLFAKATA